MKFTIFSRKNQPDFVVSIANKLYHILNRDFYQKIALKIKLWPSFYLTKLQFYNKNLLCARKTMNTDNNGIKVRKQSQICCTTHVVSI